MDAGVRPPAVRHRARAIRCDSVRDLPEPDPQLGGGECEVHADCQDGQNGRCVANRGTRFCTYDECFEDGDCGGSGVCDCGGEWGTNRCLESDCRVDTDCGPGGACSPTLGSCGDYGGTTGYYCHGPSDDCVNDSDCAEEPGAYCAFNPAAGRWRCSADQCVG